METHHPSRPWLDGSSSRKRPSNDGHADPPPKKHKHDQRRTQHLEKGAHINNGTHAKAHSQRRPEVNALPQSGGRLQTPLGHQEALAKLPKPVFATTAARPEHSDTTLKLSGGSDLPPLPPIRNVSLSSAPFIHKSNMQYSRTSAEHDFSYERLEFLGDAYLELFASRLIFHRYYQLPAGQMSQLRELLVKNETLSQYSRAYGFDEKLSMDDKSAMLDDASKRNKGLNKILGDVFEAYVAAVIVSDPVDGLAIAEQWLTALWAPKLVAAMEEQPPMPATGSANTGNDKLKMYNPDAKAELQKRIAGRNSKIEYESYQPTLELKGDKLGQNRHFIGVYFTGYGHERQCLGKGEGKNKLEAGNWAAMKALYGECKGVVEDAERRLKQEKEENKRRREEEERKKVAARADAQHSHAT